MSSAGGRPGRESEQLRRRLSGDQGAEIASGWAVGGSRARRSGRRRYDGGDAALTNWVKGRAVSQLREDGDERVRDDTVAAATLLV